MQKRRTLNLVIGYAVMMYLSMASSWSTSCGLSGVSSADAAELLVSDRVSSRILRYDADSGSYLGPLVDSQPETNGGLFMPAAMDFAFGGDLFVTSIDLETGDGQVLRYASDTGEFLGVFASGLVGPSGLHYHQASDTLLVGSLGTGLGNSNQIARFSADGTRQADIAAGPVSGRTGMVSTADGTLYASSFAEGLFFDGSVLKYNYDASTDALSYAGVFAAAPALSGANALTFDNAGDLLVVSLLGQGVVKFDVEGGLPVGSRIFATMAYPSGMIQALDGSVLVTSLGNDNPNDPIYPDLFPGAVFKLDATTGSVIGPGPFLEGDGDFQPTAIVLRPIVGDFDADWQLTANDIDLLSAEVREGTNLPKFDLNKDGLVDAVDRDVWVVDVKRTYLGDADLDGEFSTGDLVLVMAAGGYEDDIPGNSGWATGDWNGDADFTTRDLVAAFQAGGYQQGPREAVANVPEPTMATLLACAALPGAIWWRRRQRTAV